MIRHVHSLFSSSGCTPCQEAMEGLLIKLAITESYAIILCCPSLGVMLLSGVDRYKKEMLPTHWKKCLL